MRIAGDQLDQLGLTVGLGVFEHMLQMLSHGIVGNAQDSRHHGDAADIDDGKQNGAKKIAAVIFPVDAERETGFRRYNNTEMLEIAAENSDVLIPFVSIDPHKGKLGVREARRLIEEYGVKGFKFHPTMQGFYPNDRMAYPLYEAINDGGAIALFHTGQTGVGSGMPGGMGMRLKYSNPMYMDDVAADFPDLKIILAHPSFPGRKKRCRWRPTSPTSTST